MVLEWDGWGWIDVDRKIRFRTCNEDNEETLIAWHEKEVDDGA